MAEKRARIARRPVAVVALLGALFMASPAAADPAAERMFRDAKQLLRDGHVDQACDRFAESQAIEAKVGTLLNLGQCRERQGRLATAWDVFLQAKALAMREHDRRAVEAGRRAEALAPRLAFLTLVVPVEARIPGLVITRNDLDVPSSLWSAEVPIDPGRYVVVARAPGHEPRSTAVEAAREGRAIATIGALAASPRGSIETASEGHRGGDREVPVVPADDVWPAQRTLGFGPLLGVSSHNDRIVGGRVLAAIPLPDAALRGSFSVKYARFSNGSGDPNDYTDLFAFGFGLDYIRMFHRGLAAGGGLGGGIDRFKSTSADEATTGTWFTLRGSPLIVRVGTPRLELGIHVEYVLAPKITIALFGLDWFVW